jgi:hypothetical protein
MVDRIRRQKAISFLSSISLESKVPETQSRNLESKPTKLIVNENRIFFCTQGGSIINVFSVIKFKDSKKRGSSFDFHKPILEGFHSKADSYSHLLSEYISIYDPIFLDDPNLKTGKHKTVITLPSYMSSIIQYTRPSDLKQELNDKFRQIHDNKYEVKLSHIRNIKSHLLEIALAQDLELSTVAHAYVFFEKLVINVSLFCLIQMTVTKANRKVIAGICLLLAAKINDHKDLDFVDLLNVIERQMDVPAKNIKDLEFQVFVALGFNLYLPISEYLPHIERIISILDYYSLQEYMSGKSPHDPIIRFL